MFDEGAAPLLPLPPFQTFPRYLSTKIFLLINRKVAKGDKSLLFVGRYLGAVRFQLFRSFLKGGLVKSLVPIQWVDYAALVVGYFSIAVSFVVVITALYVTAFSKSNTNSKNQDLFSVPFQSFMGILCVIVSIAAIVFITALGDRVCGLVGDWFSVITFLAVFAMAMYVVHIPLRAIWLYFNPRFTGNYPKEPS
jgi:hypothetical protein